MVCGIYCIENVVDGRKYFGSSIDIEKRFNRHLSELRAGTHHNVILQRAFNKYGEVSFNFSIVEEVSDESLFVVEQRYIDGNVGGYNIAPAGGGDLISSHPEKLHIVEKMKKSLRKHMANLSQDQRKAIYGRVGSKNGMYQSSHDEQTKEKIRQKVKQYYSENCSPQKGKPLSDATKEKLSQKASLRTGDKNSFYGKSHSNETKQLLREHQLKFNKMRGVDPRELSYTKMYRITYADGSQEEIFGLATIAEKFNVSVANVHQFVKRGSIGKRGAFKGIMIEVMNNTYSNER